LNESQSLRPPGNISFSETRLRDWDARPFSHITHDSLPGSPASNQIRRPKSGGIRAKPDKPEA
ncbi:MAG: hypothetical protein VX111_03290, partial [Planctomycetota bacterium]|nr:hypothetical protein [Planctomycetota bacterium]